MDDVIFPKNATTEERLMNWQKIGEMSDMDFGFDSPKKKTDMIRFCVRVLLFNDDGKICVVKSEKYGYIQLPGGGIESNENILSALRRETEEETGFLIKNIEPIGFTLERREDVRNTHPWGRDISYVFKALPSKKVGTNYMEDEIAEGFTPIWMDIREVEQELSKNEGHIESYSGNFSNRRDLMIVRSVLNPTE